MRSVECPNCSKSLESHKIIDLVNCCLKVLNRNPGDTIGIAKPISEKKFDYHLTDQNNGSEVLNP